MIDFVVGSLLRAGRFSMKKFRCRGWYPASFIAVLLAVLMPYPQVGAMPPESRLTLVLEECIRSPTVQCVMALAIDTAGAVSDADERAWAFIRNADVQRAIGDATGARESLSRAMAAADAIRITVGHDRQAQALIGIARGQAAMGDVTGALQTLALSLASANGLDEPHRRAAILSDISVAHSRIGDEDGAHRILLLALEASARIADKSSRVGMLIDIAESTASMGDLRTTAQVVREAHKVGGRTSWRERSASVRRLAKMAKALVDAGYDEDALRIAEVIGAEDESDRATVLSYIAYTLAAAGRAADAWATEDRVWSGYSRIKIALHIGIALARTGDIAGAAGAAAKIRKIEKEKWAEVLYSEAARGRDGIFMTLAKTHATSGAYEKAHHALAEIRRGDNIANAAIGIAEAGMAVGDLDAALAGVRKVCEFRRRIDKCVQALSGLAAAHHFAGNPEMARKLVSEAWKAADETHWRASTRDRLQGFVSLWEAQMGMGDVEGARKAFSAALSVANGIRYWRTRVEKLTALANSAAQWRERMSAEQAFSLAMEAAGEVQSEYDGPFFTFRDRARAFVIVGKEQAHVGDRRGAQEAFSRVLVDAARLVEHAEWRDSSVGLFRDVALALDLAPDGANARRQ
ncbi:MAG: hypothetical protein OXF56_07680 [Rhodobacteraceae bacterium]|nr:hypothetical protein [Paracoccaceae bacterium]